MASLGTLRCSVFAAFALLLPGMGCGGSSATPTTDAATHTDAAVPGDTAAACVSDGGAPVDLSGTWAIQVNLTVNLTGTPSGLVRLCPDPQQTSAGLLLRMGIQGSGTQIMQTVQVCQVSLPQAQGGVAGCPATPLTIRLAPAPSLANYLPNFAIPVIPYTLASTAPCSPFAPPGFTVLLGVANGALANPDTDPLPSWCSPCAGTTAAECICSDCTQTGAMCHSIANEVVDSDGDGNPGVSITVSTGTTPDPLMGDAYVDFRTRPQLMGMIRSVNRIDGAINASLDYSVVGSGVTVLSSPLTAAALTSALPMFNFVPSGSNFVMLRADGTQLSQWDANGNGTIECSDIVARANNFSL